MTSHIILIRHGQTAANVEQLWHGWTDTPLTTLGQQQAALIGQRIKTEHPDTHALYASPLQRAQHTAQAIGTALNLQVQTVDNIKEYGIGVLEGQSFQNLKHEHDFFNRIENDLNYSPAEGESVTDVATRMSQALRELATRHQGEKVIAVSHGAAMALGLASLVDQDIDAWHNYVFANTSVTELKISDPTQPAELVSFNSADHLEALL